MPALVLRQSFWPHLLRSGTSTCRRLAVDRGNLAWHLVLLYRYIGAGERSRRATNQVAANPLRGKIWQIEYFGIAIPQWVNAGELPRPGLTVTTEACPVRIPKRHLKCPRPPCRLAISYELHCKCRRRRSSSNRIHRTECRTAINPNLKGRCVSSRWRALLVVVDPRRSVHREGVPGNVSAALATDGIGGERYGRNSHVPFQRRWGAGTRSDKGAGEVTRRRSTATPSRLADDALPAASDDFTAINLESLWHLSAALT